MVEPEIGNSRKRVEDPRLLRGEGAYVDDLRIEGCLHAVFVRSPHGHARIAAIDSTAAQALPGVVGVFSSADLTCRMPAPELPTPEAVGQVALPLAADTVRYVGEPIAVVVAESRQAAEDGARLVEVEYEPLAAVTRPEAATAPGAPQLHPEVPGNLSYQVRRTCGDVDGAFQRAVHRVSARGSHHRIAAVPMEPRGLLVEPTAAGGLLIHASTQAPHRLRGGLARGLGLAPAQIRVIAPDVGGGFGVKGGLYRDDLVIAALALKLGRPLKWISTRIEDLLTTQHAREQVDQAEAALDADGRVLALRIKTVGNIGAYLHGGNGGMPLRMRAFGTGAYRIEAMEVETTAVFTNTNPTGAYRGAGRPEAAFLIERLMDAAARQLNLDPAEIRRRNYIQPDEFPYTTPCGTPFDSGDYPRLLDTALARADYAALQRERDQRRARGELVGLGLATFVEQTGAGSESGLARVEADGTITAVVGSSSQGQGHRTMFAQIAADRFGVPFEQVRLLQGDTDLIPTGTGTFGSRSTVTGGGALVKACDETIDKALDLAARELEVARADVEWREGAARVIGAADRSLSLDQLAALSGPDQPLEASVTFESPLNGPTTAGAYLALVSVDRDTGRLTIERFILVDDCGVVINPRLVLGQQHGSLAQGLGEATAERLVYDDDGQVLSASLLDYVLPTAASIADWQIDRTVTPSPLNPLGVKGIGEAGPIGVPPTLVNAVLDALVPLGITDLALPLHSEQLWRAIHQAQGA
jgi:aerobic carbon-monoxide dehydrogenase large subunit